MAEKLDQVWEDCKIARAVWTTGQVISGGLTLAGATAVTGGTALLAAGVGLLFGGATTNIVASKVESSKNSAEVEKAEKLLGEAS